MQHEFNVGCYNLLRAAAVGSQVSICTLLANGADPNSPNAQGHTPLCLAVEHNHPIAVYTLLRGGADPLRYNQHGMNAIHQAADHGDPETLVILLHHVPEAINTVSRSGSTPLHYAAARDHVLCVQLLLGCGCDMSIVNKLKQTALEVAHANKNAGKATI